MMTIAIFTSPASASAITTSIWRNAAACAVRRYRWRAAVLGQPRMQENGVRHHGGADNANGDGQRLRVRQLRRHHTDPAACQSTGTMNISTGNTAR